MHHWEIKENDNYYYLHIQYKKFRTHDIVQNHLETKIYLKRNSTRLTTIHGMCTIKILVATKKPLDTSSIL